MARPRLTLSSRTDLGARLQLNRDYGEAPALDCEALLARGKVFFADNAVLLTFRPGLAFDLCSRRLSAGADARRYAAFARWRMFSRVDCLDTLASDPYAGGGLRDAGVYS